MDEQKPKDPLSHELVEIHQDQNKMTAEALRRALDETRRRNAEISALLESSRAVLEHREFKDAAQPIFNYCKNFIGATAGYIALLSDDETRNEVLFLDSGGLPCTVDPSLPMPVRGLRAQAYSTGKAVRDNDFSSSEWQKFMPPGHAELENVLFAPIMIKGKAVGLIGIANKHGGFTGDDELSAARFSELVAIALYNYRTLKLLEKREEALRKAHDELEIRVRERTSDLAKTNAALKSEIEERRRAEQEIEWLATFPRLNPNPVLEVDFSGKITYKNVAAQETLKRHGKKEDANLLFPEDFNEILKALEKKQETKFYREVKIKDRILEEHIFIAVPFNTVRIYAFDITERKRAEEEREHLLDDIQNEQKQVIELAMNLKSEMDALEVIMENTEAQLAYLDSEFNFITVNSAYAKGSGHTREELIGRNHFDLFPNPENKAIFEKVRDTGEAVEFRGKPFEFADQPERGITYWDWTLTPVKDESGNVERLVLSLVDVTERIKAVKALEKSLTYAESIVDTVRIPIVILDSDLRVKMANQAFYKTFRISIEDTKNKFLYDLGNGIWNIPDLRKQLEKVISSRNEISGYEIDRELPAIGRRKLLLDARRIHRKSAGAELILLALEDITDRKKMEEILIENERPIYANKSKSEFLNIFGHELRTPLTSVVGYSVLLKEQRFGKLNKKQESYLEGVLASSKHLLDLINNILELGKLEAGKARLNIEQISVQETINDTLNLFKDEAEINNIVLTKKLDPALDLMEADRLKFKLILFNLLSNAIKFSKQKGGTVTISSEKVGGFASISVSDSGIGIRKKDMPRLFQKFEQLDRGLSRKYQGSGLGLAITKQLVELHSGTIMVESKYGKGSTFTFIMPLSAGKQAGKPAKKRKRAG